MKKERLKLREVYTVTRPLGTVKQTLLDETGDYLYGGTGEGEEKIEVRLEQWDPATKEWKVVYF